MKYSLSDKISLLNQRTLDALVFHDVSKIAGQFTEAGLELLEADYGFAWWQTSERTAYHLIYKSPGTPYEPNLPRKRGGNFEAQKTRAPFFVEKVLSRNYEKKFDISPYMKSYVIIPITYKSDLYGNIVLCYKKSHSFSNNDRVLATALGNSTAQTITINNLLEKERRALQTNAEQEAHIRESRTRTEFIANATHELRTPLAIIKGTVDLALRGGEPSPTETAKTLRAIDHEIKHLSGLISDMAQLTSSDTPSRTKLAFSEVRLNRVIEQAVRRCGSFSSKKHVSIRIKNIPDVVINGDELYLDKLFVNIIKNAITYGKRGGFVDIAGSVRASRVRIDIRDDGIGISKKDFPHIFERFYRTAAAKAENGAGTGLGLAISKWVAEAHGGTVSVKSIENKGSVFTVSLPLDNL